MKTKYTHEEVLEEARSWLIETIGHPANLSTADRLIYFERMGLLAEFLHLLYKEKRIEDALPKEEEEPGKKPSDEGYKFVDWFVSLLAETEAPKLDITEAARNRWADCYDKMIRIDKRTKEQVVLVCRFGRHDPFWRQNFFSPSKLRDKKDDVMLFDKFLAKATADTTFTPGRPKAGPDIYSEPPDWRERYCKKFPNAELPESWASLSSTIRNALLEK